jgi:hypothetical protein
MPRSDQMPEETIAAELRGFWWLHDARWYQGVLRRFGPEVANEINTEALQFVCRRIARWYRTTHGLDFTQMPMAEFVKRFAEIPQISWTEKMMAVEHHALSEDEWETVISEHFVLKMLKAARSVESYRCICPEMRAAWFEGIGVSMTDRRLECMLEGAKVCRFRAVRDGS